MKTDSTFRRLLVKREAEMDHSVAKIGGMQKQYEIMEERLVYDGKARIK